jgi:hypothetical protein
MLKLSRRGESNATQRTFTDARHRSPALFNALQSRGYFPAGTTAGDKTDIMAMGPTLRFKAWGCCCCICITPGCQIGLCT